MGRVDQVSTSVISFTLGGGCFYGVIPWTHGPMAHAYVDAKVVLMDSNDDLLPVE